MVRFLASLRFMALVSAALVVALLAGILFGRLDTWRTVVRSPVAAASLSRQMVADWFARHAADHPLIAGWIGLLAVLGLLLFLNLVLCCGTTLWRRWRAQRTAENALLLAVHLAFGVSMLCHGLSFVWGEKTVVRLAQGDTATLPDGTVVRAAEVHFAGDPAVLRLERHERTSANYRWAENYARLEVVPPGAAPAGGRVRHLYPWSDPSGRQYSVFRFVDLANPMGGHGTGPATPPATAAAEGAPSAPQREAGRGDGEGRGMGHGDGSGRGRGMGMGTTGVPAQARADAAPASRPAVEVFVTRHHFVVPFVVSFGTVILTMAGLLAATWAKRLAPEAA